MKETERRISQYQKILPGLKAKLSMAAMMFVIAIVMMTSATFAWLTLSRSPEVKGMETTVTANGNLEIALVSSISDANGEAKEPADSAVGDSKLDLIEKNITWGNLVNLSDDSYGIEKLVLRPAMLNTSSLLESPLFSVTYDNDGRINNYTSEFSYCYYDAEKKEFVACEDTAPHYGARTISSYYYTIAGGSTMFYDLRTAALGQLAVATTKYIDITDPDNIVDTENNKSYMDIICDIMGDNLTESFSSGDVVDYRQYVDYIYMMMQDLEVVYGSTAQSMYYLTGMQGIAASKSYTIYEDVDAMLVAARTGSLDDTTKIKGIEEFANDVKTFQEQLVSIKTISEEPDSEPVSWEELEPVVAFLININSTKIGDQTVASLKGDKSTAASMVLSGEVLNGEIQDGALVDLERMIGAYMQQREGDPLSITVTVDLKGIPYTATVKAYVATLAKKEQADYLESDIETTRKNLGSITGDTKVAADTYGMSIDLWVRTNATDDYLILEGHTTQKVDAEGNKYYINTDDGQTIIQKGDSYYTEKGEVVDSGRVEGKLKPVIGGYEGENRIWDDEELTLNSTTQGAGSCYIFYADTPQIMSQSFEVLEAFSVAFIDDKGNHLATAVLDTESYYAESGRVVVPLKLDNKSITIGTDIQGNDIHAITNLERGEATRISAIVYVDGSKLENADVLAENNIQGKLNIQFGSSSTMEPLIDEGIYYDEIEITGSVTPDSFSYATLQKGESMTSTVTLEIDGITPDKVIANFIRKINDMQGSRQEGILFTKTATGVYTATMEFSSPGDYILRTVNLDGIEYEINSDIEVNITGFAINSLDWDYDSKASIMTAEHSISEDVYIQFATGADTLEPKKVQGVFENEDNQQVTFDFVKGSGNWKGTAQFLTSGTYKLQYLILDGEYYEIPTTLQKTLDLTLGIKAVVEVENPTIEGFKIGNTHTRAVTVQIKDDKGNLLEGLQNIKLQYRVQGATSDVVGLHTSLTWNATSQQYKGDFIIVSAGLYNFAYIQIGADTDPSASRLDSAIATPVTVIPPDPPSFYKGNTASSIFAFAEDATMKVVLKESTAIAPANMVAVMAKLDEDGNVLGSVEVTANNTIIPYTLTEEDESGLIAHEWSFAIPTDSYLSTNGYSFNQVGTWVITELKIGGAYVDGVISDLANNPYIITLDGETGLTTDVSDDMKVVVAIEDNVTATDGVIDLTNQAPLFMESSYASNGIKIQIQSNDGQFVNPELLSNVTVTYKMSLSDVYSDSSTEEGYVESTTSSTFVNEESITADATLIYDKGSQAYIIDAFNGKMELPLAGTYEFDKLEFTINTNGDINSTADDKYFSTDKDDGVLTIRCEGTTPKYLTKWDAPVVNIKDVYPAVTKEITACPAGLYRNEKKSVYNSIESNKLKCSVYLTATYSWGSCNGYTDIPTVTTELSNINSFNSASIVFNSTTDDGFVVTYNYPSEYGEKIDTETVASWAWPVRKTLGESKVNYITISGTLDKNTVEFVFKLDDTVTIYNPY